MDRHAWVPPGYIPLLEIVSDAGRGELLEALWSGQRVAFYRDDYGRLVEVPKNLWGSDFGDLFIRTGFWSETSYPFGPSRVIFLKSDVGKRDLPKAKNHRPTGTGLERADAPLLKKMRELIETGVCNSPTAAARTAISQSSKSVASNCSVDSMIRRLVRRYKANFPTGDSA